MRRSVSVPKSVSRLWDRYRMLSFVQARSQKLRGAVRRVNVLASQKWGVGPVVAPTYRATVDVPPASVNPKRPVPCLD